MQKIIQTLTNKLILTSCVFIFFSSCINYKNTLENKLVGDWEIRQISYGANSYKDNLYVNFISIKENKNISIPESYNFKKDPNSEWNLVPINKRTYKFKINSLDTVFAGLYEMNFIKDEEKKLLGIELISNTTYIQLFKFRQNYNRLQRKW